MSAPFLKRGRVDRKIHRKALQVERGIEDALADPAKALPLRAGEPEPQAAGVIQHPALVFRRYAGDQAQMPDQFALVAEREIGGLLVVKHQLQHMLHRHRPQGSAFRLQFRPDEERPHDHPEGE